MTVWRADAKKTPLQQEETDGELLDIPGWRLATARKVPTEIADSLKKSFCGLVNALLEWYLKERDPTSNPGTDSLSTRETKRPRRWKSDVKTMDGSFRGQASTAEHVKGFSAEWSSQVSKAVLGAVQYQGAKKKG